MSTSHSKSHQPNTVIDHLLWITDPWDTLDHPKDTTLRLIQESHQMGVRQSWCDVKSIRLENGKVLLHSYPITAVSRERTANGFEFGQLQVLSPSSWRQIHYRTDPPVNQDYLYPLQLIALDLNSSPSHTEVINPLAVLFSRNEKLEPYVLKEHMPDTVVGCSWDVLQAFGMKQQKTVLKPLNEAQSKGIELLQWGTPSLIMEARAKIEALSHGFKTPVLLQKYLDEIHQGETRLWFADGDLIGVINKLPLAQDFRVNLDLGSKLTQTSLTEDQKSVSCLIGKHLQGAGIRLAAVDLIGTWITDFNFTSPGLIPQMENILGINLARLIMEKTLP